MVQGVSSGKFSAAEWLFHILQGPGCPSLRPHVTILKTNDHPLGGRIKVNLNGKLASAKKKKKIATETETERGRRGREEEKKKNCPWGKHDVERYPGQPLQ